jgi:hypothetical protein
MKSTTLADSPTAAPRPGRERRSAASLIERETELRLARGPGARTPLLPLIGAAVTAVIALAAAGALIA